MLEYIGLRWNTLDYVGVHLITLDFVGKCLSTLDNVGVHSMLEYIQCWSSYNTDLEIITD